MTSDRYTAHARRIALLQRAADEVAREYLAGYCAGMAQATRAADLSSEDAARSRLAEAAIAGTLDRPSRLAWGCGYHDGRVWETATAHRGLLRFAAHRLAGGSMRALARKVLGIDEGNLRQMLRGTRPVPADLRDELLDRVLGLPDDLAPPLTTRR